MIKHLIVTAVVIGVLVYSGLMSFNSKITSVIDATVSKSKAIGSAIAE